MNDVIITENLQKHFGTLKAVDGINLHVKQGEIYGFLGLNGAGKTTTIRMLLGMIRPTSGDVFLHGIRVKSAGHALWNRVGYLVEIPYAYPDLTVSENLEIIRRLRFITEPGVVDNIIEKLQLGSYRNRLAKNLSLGNAQRLGLAKALLHNPDLLLLDEPANGLDPAGIAEIREMLRYLAAEKGVTILISSHILGEIAKFATRVGIIHEGMLLRESDTGHLVDLRYKSLHVSTQDNQGARTILEKEGYEVAGTNDDFLILSGKNAINQPASVNSFLVQAGFPPHLLKVEEEDLESYFLRVIHENGGIK